MALPLIQQNFRLSGTNTPLDLTSQSKSDLSARVTTAAAIPLPLSTPRSRPLEPRPFIRPKGMPLSDFSALLLGLKPTDSRSGALFPSVPVKTFTDACELPDIPLLKKLLKSQPAQNIPDETIHKECLKAVKSGNIDLVQVFLHSQRSMLPQHQGGVLIAGAVNQQLAVVRAFISSPLFKSIQIQSIEAAYVEAARGGNHDIINELGSSERMNNISGELFGRALLEAAKNGSSNIVADFISKELFKQISTQSLREAFRYAAHLWHHDVTKLLVDSNRSEELLPEFGLALVNATRRGDLEMVHILIFSTLFRNADPKDFETACLTAFQSKNLNILNLLIPNLSREEYKIILKKLLNIIPKDPNEVIIRPINSSSGVLELSFERNICNNLAKLLWTKIAYM